MEHVDINHGLFDFVGGSVATNAYCPNCEEELTGSINNILFDEGRQKLIVFCSLYKRKVLRGRSGLISIATLPLELPASRKLLQQMFEIGAIEFEYPIKGRPGVVYYNLVESARGHDIDSEEIHVQSWTNH